MSLKAKNGFSMVEVVVALTLVGVGVTALLLALSQGRRNLFHARRWSDEESRATAILMEQLGLWEQLRSETARRSAQSATGQDVILGSWEWRAEPEQIIPGQTVGLYRIQLRWNGGQVNTKAALRAFS